ncbi:hypothetical protein TNCV_3933511 [Trichonephila clavipes]|nr:hypothetical protein TNCV_3933511 [Trichonephila clavipes]
MIDIVVKPATGYLLVTELVILNYGQVIRKTPELELVTCKPRSDTLTTRLPWPQIVSEAKSVACVGKSGREYVETNDGSVTGIERTDNLVILMVKETAWITEACRSIFPVP